METVFMIVALLAAVGFIIGMFSPKTVKCKTRGRVALIFISVFLLSAIIGSTFSEDPTTKATPQTVSTTEEQPKQQQQQTSQETEIESSIGKPIEIGHFVYTIESILFRKSVGNELVEETADGIYMLVNLSIKNISNETRTLDGSLFTATDKKGTKYDYSINASTALEMSGAKTLFLKECHPNITTKGVLVFEVPQKDEYYLHLIGSFLGDNSVRVLLK